MKRILIIMLLAISATVQAQVLLDEGFDNGIPERWKMFTDSNTTHNADFRDAWNLTTNYGLPAPAVISASWFETPAQADRWLITDTVFIPDSGYVFSVDAAAYEQAYPDGFAVKVSTNGAMFRNNFDMGYLISVSACSGGMESYTASLDAYVGRRVHFAVIQNSSDMNFLIVDNIKVYKPEKHAVALTQINVPEYCLAETPFTPSVTIKNTGKETMYNIHVDYYVAGDTVANYFDNIELFPDGVMELTLSSHSIASLGNHQVTVHAYAPNGMEDNEEDNYLHSDIQIFNISQTAIRHTIIEEFSDLRDGYSVSGHSNILQAMRGNVHCSSIVHHANSEDLLSSEGSMALKFFYSDTTNCFTPAYMIDRRPIAGTNEVVVEPANSTTIQNNIIAAQMRPSFLQLSISQPLFNEETRQVGGTVTGRFKLNNCDSNTRIVVYLTEDSLYQEQFDYTYGVPEDNYTTYLRSNGIVRKAISAPMGDLIDVDANGDFTYSYSDRIPDNYRAWRCRVVAIVYHLDSLYNRCQVLNSAKSLSVRSTYYDIDELDDGLQISIYPNPASQQVQISSSEEIEAIRLTDQMGRIILSEEKTEANSRRIDVSHLSEGIYFVTLKTKKGSATRKLVIAR